MLMLSTVRWMMRALTWGLMAACLCAAGMLVLSTSSEAFGLLRHSPGAAHAPPASHLAQSRSDDPLARKCRRLEDSELTPRDNSGQLIMPYVCGPYE